MGSISQRHCHLLCIKSVLEENKSPFFCANSGVPWPGYHLEPMPSHTCNFKTIPSPTPEDFCTFLLSWPSSLCYFSRAAFEGGSALLNNLTIALGKHFKRYLQQPILQHFVGLQIYLYDYQLNLIPQQQNECLKMCFLWKLKNQINVNSQKISFSLLLNQCVNFLIFGSYFLKQSMLAHLQ